jgi:hypothetical protein
MRPSLVLLALLAACHRGGPPATPTPPPAPPAPAEALGPAMVRIPDGWTDLVTASRDDVEPLAPGMYDQAQGMIERNGYLTMAYDLRAGSPDQGSSMTMLPMLYERGTTIDDAFLGAFIAGNNLDIDPELTVEARVLEVRGRPIGKWRSEYDGAKHRVTSLVYLFASDAGQLLQLVFVVRTARYEALRTQLEAIER